MARRVLPQCDSARRCASRQSPLFEGDLHVGVGLFLGIGVREFHGSSHSLKAGTTTYFLQRTEMETHGAVYTLVWSPNGSTYSLKAGTTTYFLQRMEAHGAVYTLDWSLHGQYTYLRVG